MKKICKQIISIILFVTIMMIGIVQISYLYRGEFSHSRAHVAGFYAEDKNSLDVIFTGSSYMFCSFIPMEAWHDYGMASYNLSINMMFSDSYKYFLREALKTQSPKLYVIDCGVFADGLKSSNYLNTTDEEGVATIQTNADTLNYSLNRFELVRKIMQDTAIKSNHYFDLLYYHESMWPSFKYKGNKRRSPQKGYSELPLFEDEIYVNEDVLTVNTEEIPLDDESKEIFLDLIDELKKYDMQVLFVSQPDVFVSEKYYTKQGRIKYMKRIVEENGYEYLDMGDYRDEININPTFDLSLGVGDHFTFLGAEKTTDFLSRYIHENYDIPDRRHDKRYSGWHSDYEEWLSIKNNIKENNIEAMNRVFTEESNLEKMPGILENAEEYFVVDNNKVVNIFSGEEIIF